MSLIDCTKIRDRLDRFRGADQRTKMIGTARPITTVDSQTADNARDQFAIVLSAEGLADNDNLRLWRHGTDLRTGGPAL